MIERQSARTKGRVHLPLDQGQDGGDRPAHIERCQQGTWPGHFLRHDHQAPERRARHVVQKTPKHNRSITGGTPEFRLRAGWSKGIKTAPKYAKDKPEVRRILGLRAGWCGGEADFQGSIWGIVGSGYVKLYA